LAAEAEVAMDAKAIYIWLRAHRYCPVRATSGPVSIIGKVVRIDPEGLLFDTDKDTNSASKPLSGVKTKLC
jgi:hypothetical protein